jgi:RNA polymerase sigma factor (sigma-70 family)
MLWEKYAPKLFGICLRHCRTQTEAEEVLQESFIKVFDKLADYKNEGSFEGWIRRITVNTALTHLRLTHKFTFETDTDAATQLSNFAFEPLEKVEAKDLLVAIKKLPENYKVVLNLYCIDGYSHQEIANQLDISVSASRVLLHRAKQILSQKLGHKKKEISAYEQ